MSSRVEALREALDALGIELTYRDLEVGLSAADAVMFSDEAMDRARDEVTGYQIGSGYYSLTIGSGDADEIVREVIKALKGDA